MSVARIQKRNNSPMYFAIDTVDLEAKGPDGPLVVQFDDRTPEEVAATPDLSTLFAMARVLVPRLHRPPEERASMAVHYQAQHQLPDDVADAIRAAGATLATGTEPSIPTDRVPLDEPATQRLFARAMTALGHRVIRREEVASTQQGIETLERRFAAAWRSDGAPRSPDTDPLAYYTAMFELVAAAGVAFAHVRSTPDGGTPHWRFPSSDEPISLVPFVLDLAGSDVNLFGRCERFLDGESESGPSALFDIPDPDDQDPADHPLVAVLKPRDWGDHRLLREPLLPVPPDVDVPWIAYARDHPRALAYEIDADRRVSLAEARAAAAAHAETIQPDRSTIELPSGGSIVVLEGSFFAAEKILDRRFMRELQGELGAQTLAVGVPARGVAGITAADDVEAASAAIRSFNRQEQEDAAPDQRISQAVLLVRDGRVSGLVRFDEDEGAPRRAAGAPLRGRSAAKPRERRAGWWRRLFGG